VDNASEKINVVGTGEGLGKPWRGRKEILGGSKRHFQDVMVLLQMGGGGLRSEILGIFDTHRGNYSLSMVRGDAGVTGITGIPEKYTR